MIGSGGNMHIEFSDVVLVTETTVTIRQSRRRTTVPKEIVDRLGIAPNDKLRWVLLTDGTLIVSKIDVSGNAVT
jgi:bifunctional DNA-binding transcriptional regulator/antitoxin component of YhaV-PrlF toxin-antitoxin module